MTNNIEILKPNFETDTSLSSTVMQKEDNLAMYMRWADMLKAQQIQLIFSNGVKTVTAKEFVGMVHIWEESNVSTQRITTDYCLDLESEINQEIDDLQMLNLYVKPQPTQKFKVKGTIKSIKKGEIIFFPDEFETI